MTVTICRSCNHPSRIVKREVEDQELYGDRRVPRFSLVEETACCGADFVERPSGVCTRCGDWCRRVPGFVDGYRTYLSGCCEAIVAGGGA